MNLHENERLFRDSVRFTAQQRGIKEIYIEKDYWVTLALHTIFNSEAAEYAVFKGGTALSKCYGIIERFSEDIDLVVLNKGETGNQLKKKLGALSKSIEHVLPEIEVTGITNKRGMIRKTAHAYKKLFEGNYGQVRDFIVLESTWLGYHEPYSNRKISSYIYYMMIELGQGEMVVEYNLAPFEVRVLEPTRTICEKIMSLVRFSHSSDPIGDLRLKVRHLYDLNQLLTIPELGGFLDSPDFDKMLLKVASDDVEGYRTGNEWLAEHPVKALLFRDPESVWKQIEPVYRSQFADLVFGKLPEPSTVLQTISRIADRMKSIKWDIKLAK